MLDTYIVLILPSLTSAMGIFLFRQFYMTFPISLYESAKLDGCGWLKRIVKLDLPMILPQIKYILITSFIGSIQNYGTIYVVRGTSGPVYTPALCMYSEIMQSNYGLASAQSVILFLFLMVATILNFRIQSDQS